MKYLSICILYVLQATFYFSSNFKIKFCIIRSRLPSCMLENKVMLVMPVNAWSTLSLWLALLK